jgi:hypothetical protein
MTASEQHARWRQLITRVEVGRGQLWITVDLNGMMNTELVKPEDGAGREKLRQGQGRGWKPPGRSLDAEDTRNCDSKAPCGNLCPTPCRICDRGGSGLSMER